MVMDVPARGWSDSFVHDKFKARIFELARYFDAGTETLGG
jgi:hypothetical protein